MVLSKKKVALYLVAIGLISLIFKLYLVDFSIPLYSDDLGYTLNAIAHSHGDFAQIPDKGEGWPYFISLFFLVINSNNYIDYSNVVRILSLSISTFSIFTVYLLGKKFFNEKYSLIPASLFAFEPHLNYISGFGLAEPLYHMVMILAFYFILNRETRYFLLSMLLIGVLWWIRINGFILLPVIIAIYFINFRKSQNLLKNFGFGIAIFLIVVSPMLMQRYNQYGNPFHFWYDQNIFTGDYEKIVSVNTETTNTSALDYIQKNGILSFIHTFILTGFYNILHTEAKILFPYLIILVPFGIIFSFRAFDQEKNFIKASWILIVVTAGLTTITFSIFPDRRYLYYLYPFLIIFATIPIQRVTEYGLSTFSFSNRKKDAFLFFVIVIVIILSGLFTMLQYHRPDQILENEKILFAKFAVHNLNGKILRDPGPALDYFTYVKLDDPLGNFKTFIIDTSNKSDHSFLQQSGNLTRIYIYGKTMDELITNGETYDLKYIISDANGSVFHSFVDDVYKNENRYPYLKKVFDSEEHGFKELRVKVLEIDYKKFHEQK